MSKALFIFLAGFSLLFFSPFSVCAENVILTTEQWQSLKDELKILKDYYNENESLRIERENELKQRQLSLQERERVLAERESALSEREIDLRLRESFQEERENLLIESTDLLKTSKRDSLIFKILAAVGLAGSLSGWTAFAATR